MNPKQFLLLGGIILVALAVIGVVGLGPTASDSALGELFFLTTGENVAHLLFGVVALLAYYFLKDAQLTKWLVILVGIVSLVAGIGGFLVSSTVSPNVPSLSLNLENPADNILHLVVAIWAFWAAFMSKGDSAPKPVV